MGSWRQRYARGPGPVKGFVTVPRTITKQVRMVSPSLRLPAVVCSPSVLATDRPPADQGIGGGGGHQGTRAPRQHDYSPTGDKTSHTNRGSCSFRVPGYELENSPHQGPAIRPGHTGQKIERRARVFLRRLFFPIGWTRRWKRSLTRTLSVVSCLGGQGGVAGGGEFVCVGAGMGCDCFTVTKPTRKERTRSAEARAQFEAWKKQNVFHQRWCAELSQGMVGVSS